jgi:plastin-1
LTCSSPLKSRTTTSFPRSSQPRRGKCNLIDPYYSEVSQSVGESGFTHSYLVEEKICFAKLVNEFLKAEEDLADVVLPLNPENDDLFHAMESGVVLAKLINIAVENTIDFRAMNKKKNLNIY